MVEPTVTNQNLWKWAFFGLLAVVILVACLILYLLFSVKPSDYVEQPVEKKEAMRTLTMSSTTSDFESIANTYIEQAMKGKQDFPIHLQVKDEVILQTEMKFFSSVIPVQMYFDPFVTEQGNLLLKLNELEIGRLNLSPKVVMKLVSDAKVLPNWMIILPKEEQLIIDFSKIPFANGVGVRVKAVDLAADEIELWIDVPVIE